MKLPDGELIAIENDNTETSIAITDIMSHDEFIKEVNYLLNHYYNDYKNKVKAIKYIENNQVIYLMSIKELFKKEN